MTKKSKKPPRSRRSEKRTTSKVTAVIGDLKNLFQDMLEIFEEDIIERH